MFILQCYLSGFKFQFQHSKISLGCPVLDNTLRGGLLIPGINEISGESGSGKTQIALQICLAMKVKRENSLQGGTNSVYFQYQFSLFSVQHNQFSAVR